MNGLDKYLLNEELNDQVFNGTYRFIKIHKEKFNDMLKRIYHGEKYFSASEEITELLQLGVVLEYNGERWCDLHPLVKKWLKEHNRV